MIKQTHVFGLKTSFFDGMPIIAYVLNVSIQELFLKTVTNYVKWVKEIQQCIVYFPVNIHVELNLVLSSAFIIMTRFALYGILI